MLHVLIVDDDAISREITASALQQFDVTIVGTAASGNEAVDFLRHSKVDLVFLDIEMDEMDGFETANCIYREFPEVMYVFLTGHVEYALSGYDYQPLSFLSKPISISRLEHVLEMAERKKASADSMGQHVRQVGIHVNGQLEILRTDEVAYMENSGRRVHVVCRDQREFYTSESLKKLALIFEEYGFFRSHQSVVVNVELIEAIQPDMFKRTFQLKLKGIPNTLPLSRDRKAKLENLLCERGLQVL
jgi:DNA-binding LytR/AlgR family response regulator